MTRRALLAHRARQHLAIGQSQQGQQDRAEDNGDPEQARDDREGADESGPGYGKFGLSHRSRDIAQIRSQGEPRA